MKAAFGSLHNHTRYIYDIVMDANMAVGAKLRVTKTATPLLLTPDWFKHCIYNIEYTRARVRNYI